MNPSRKEKLYWSRLASIVGCIACKLDGNNNHYVAIHHCDGRTKIGSHMKVLPLCAAHHQTGGEDAPSIHPWKNQFIAKYGTQEYLMELCEGLVDANNN